MGESEKKLIGHDILQETAFLIWNETFLQYFYFIVRKVLVVFLYSVQ